MVCFSEHTFKQIITFRKNSAVLRTHAFVTVATDKVTIFFLSWGANRLIYLEKFVI